jgi:EAL domain-containing protein (putative c-di-GMP-specific phosphodiesterase class I)
VHPRYLKLDRSLVTGIDTDEQRSALVAALAADAPARTYAGRTSAPA